MVQEGRDPVLITRSALRPFLAEAYLLLGLRDEADRELAALSERGYRERALQELAEGLGLSL